MAEIDVVVLIGTNIRADQPAPHFEAPFEAECCRVARLNAQGSVRRQSRGVLPCTSNGQNEAEVELMEPMEDLPALELEDSVEDRWQFQQVMEAVKNQKTKDEGSGQDAWGDLSILI